jgi:hypothetical protein
MTKPEFEWYEFPSGKRKGMPKWQRRAAIAGDGTIFIPAIVAGGENTVFLCAGYDGTRVVYHSGHLYVPSDWVKREFPQVADVALKIEGRVAEASRGQAK